MEILCEKCRYNSYDEESDEYFCALEPDEDEYALFLQNNGSFCRYFYPDNGEYEIVRRQN